MNLLDAAARELLDARTLDAGHPALTGLEVRLREMLDQQVARAEAKQLAQPPVEDPNAATVAEAEPLAPISADAQVAFLRSIQPMLVHNCATGGCHQSGQAQHFQLNRWALEGRGNADLVRRNVAAVVREINFEEPATSPLASWARTPHGPDPQSQSRPLSARQSALLLDWLNLATGKANPLAQVDPFEVAPDGGGIETAEFERELTAPSGLERASHLEGYAPAMSVEPRARSRRFTPRDAFDAEIFNRRQARGRGKRSCGKCREYETPPRPAVSCPMPLRRRLKRRGSNGDRFFAISHDGHGDRIARKHAAAQHRARTRGPQRNATGYWRGIIAAVAAHAAAAGEEQYSDGGQLLRHGDESGDERGRTRRRKFHRPSGRWALRQSCAVGRAHGDGSASEINIEFATCCV